MKKEERNNELTRISTNIKKGLRTGIHWLTPRKRSLLPITYSLIMLFLVLGCSDIFNMPTLPEVANGNGGVAVRIASDDVAPRTLYPTTLFTKYVLEFSGPGTYAPVTISGTSVLIDDLPNGSWTITAYGIVLINGTEYRAAEGTAVVNVSAGSFADVSIAISASMTGDNGFFNYSVTYPVDVGVETAQMQLYKFGTPLAEQPAVINLFTNLSDSLAREPGYYVMIIKLEDDQDRVASRSEIVHIYSNMETVANFVFDREDFAAKPTSIRINGLSGKNGKEVYPYLLGSAEVDIYNKNPAIYGEGLISGGSVTIELYDRFNNNTPWYGNGSFYVFLEVESDNAWGEEFYISRVMHDFTVKSLVEFNFTDFKRISFRYTFGDLADNMREEHPQGVTLNDWFLEVMGVTYTDAMVENFIIDFFKDEELTVLYAGTELIFADTVFYLEVPGMLQYMGNKIGEITGTITLTGIKDPPQSVEIQMNHQYGYWYIYKRIPIPAGTGSEETFTFTFPIFENDNFSNTNAQFRLYIRPSGSRNDFQIQLPNKYVSLDTNVGNLGTYDISSITVSGTIDVTVDGEPVPTLEIAIIKQQTGQRITSTMINEAGNETEWAVVLPVFDTPTDIYFRILGYPYIILPNEPVPDGDILFNKVYYPLTAITLSNVDVPNIHIDLGDIPDPRTPVNPVPLEEGVWKDGQITVPYAVDWYSIDVTEGQYYYIWTDGDWWGGSGTKTMQTEFYGYDSSKNRLFYRDAAWYDPAGYYANSDGTIYIKVRAVNEDAYTGTYGIAYTTSYDRPLIQGSIVKVFGNLDIWQSNNYPLISFQDATNENAAALYTFYNTDLPLTGKNITVVYNVNWNQNDWIPHEIIIQAANGMNYVSWDNQQFFEIYDQSNPALSSRRGAFVIDGDILELDAQDGGFDLTGFRIVNNGGNGKASSYEVRIESVIVTDKPIFYTVTIPTTEGGTVTATQSAAIAGTQITLTIAPVDGYYLDSLNVTGDTAVALSGTGYTRTFAMPSSNVTVNAVFELIPDDSQVVSFTFTGFGDEEIDLTHNAAYNIQLYNYLHINVSSDYDSYQWYINGEFTWDNNGNYYASFYMDPGTYAIGNNSIAVVVYKNGVPYSKEVTFRVVR